MTSNKAFLAFALSATLLFSGCIGSGEDGGLSFLDTGDSSGGDVRVVLGAVNASEADVSHLGAQLDGVFLHEQSIEFPEGYHQLDVVTGHADVVADGSGVTAIVANGTLPAGTYDQVMLQLDGVEVHKTSSSGHDHAGGGAHDHGSNDTSASASAVGPQDVPINVTFDVTEDELHQIKITLDVAASTGDGGFQPTLDVVVTRGSQTLAEASVGQDTTESTTQPPAARMSVFAPNGDQLYEPGFTTEQGVFVNGKSSAIPTGETVRFSGTESEAVAGGATITSHAWDFDDGETATGATVAHAFDKPGVYEVELTVEDSNGVTASHMARVVVWGWTTTLVNTTFEEQGDWSTTAADTSLTTWALDGEGRTDASAWHVGTHLHNACPDAASDGCPNQYTPEGDATLTSPEIQIPSDWKGAGVEMYLMGGSEACCDVLGITYTVDGEPTQLGTFSGSQGWTLTGSKANLDGAIGKTVQFTFHFGSDIAVQEGPGWYLDDFVIGGVAGDDLHKAHLLEEGGHGGHDHSHG